MVKLQRGLVFTFQSNKLRDSKQNKSNFLGISSLCQPHFYYLLIIWTIFLLRWYIILLKMPFLSNVHVVSVPVFNLIRPTYNKPEFGTHRLHFKIKMEREFQEHFETVNSWIIFQIKIHTKDAIFCSINNRKPLMPKEILETTLCKHLLFRCCTESICSALMTAHIDERKTLQSFQLSHNLQLPVSIIV